MTDNSPLRATYAAFAANGFLFASWASRIPAVKAKLHLSPKELGLVLLAIAAGSVLALPTSGPLVARFGSRRTVAVNAVIGGAAIVLVAFGYQLGVPVVVVGLFFMGMATGLWDVAMNVQGALVEQHIGRAIMPRFHAGWSLGTVAGALIGTVLVAAHVGVTVHLALVGLVIAVGVPNAVRAYLPDKADPDHDVGKASREAWTEPRTLLVGVFVLAFAFAEGAGNDWIGVATIEDHHSPPAIGTLALAVFLASMTTSRWFGPHLLDRYGRVPVLRSLGAVAIAGLALFIFSPLPFLGVILWGTGTALGFPVGMSAGADDPARAAPRVSVISSIGYCAFLAGPPLIGFLAQRDTVSHALIAVMITLGVASLLTTAVRPLRASSLRSPHAAGR